MYLLTELGSGGGGGWENNWPLVMVALTLQGSHSLEKSLNFRGSL